MSADPLITIDTDVDREVLIQTITQAAEGVIDQTFTDEAAAADAPKDEAAPLVLVAVALTFRLLSGQNLMGLGGLLMTPEERERLVADFTSGATQGTYTYFRKVYEPGAHRLDEYRLAVRFADVLCLS